MLNIEQKNLAIIVQGQFSDKHIKDSVMNRSHGTYKTWSIRYYNKLLGKECEQIL